MFLQAAEKERRASLQDFGSDGFSNSSIAAGGIFASPTLSVGVLQPEL